MKTKPESGDAADSPSVSEPWLPLISRLFDDALDADEMEELGAWLEKEEEAREALVAASELHAMLESEPGIRAALARDRLPENVVAMGEGARTPLGAGPVATAAASARPVVPTTSAAPVAAKLAAAGGAAARETFPWRALVGLSGLAAAVVAAMVLVPKVVERALTGAGLSPTPEMVAARGEGERRHASGGAESASEAPPLLAMAGSDADPDTRRRTGALRPEEQYERAALAALGSGSQQRPATNFSAEPSADAETLSFNRHIRPILSENCYACHGPDEAHRSAGMRLDTREGATEGDHPAIVPGDPGGSELMARVRATDPDDIMPPPESHKKLTPAQIELLAAWIEAGAEWEEHWSFEPLLTEFPQLDVEAEGEAKGEAATHPLDRFVDAELRRHGLERSPEADPRTLARRVALDLTGLPPTPEELARYLEDPGEEAYATWVEELLERPAFGEHRARYWLDAARYADTHGLHLDNYREMWPYRDWVVSAFNRNLPFDRFTVEQLAGDLLPEATLEQQVATGFNRCNVTTSEGGSIAEEFEVRYAVDRVATTATVWMGLTAACAQCHDHKYDPMTMRDFYRLFAFFNHTTQPAMDRNAKDSPPVVRLFHSPEAEEVAGELEREIAALKKEAAALLASYEPAGDATVEAVSPPLLDHGDGENPSSLGEAGRFGRDSVFSVGFRFQLPEGEGPVLLASRLESGEPGKPGEGKRGWRVFADQDMILVELIESHPDRMLKRATTRVYRRAASGHFAFSYDGSGSSEGIRLYRNGDPQDSRFVNQWFDTLEDDFLAEGAELLVGGTHPGSGRRAEITEFFLEPRRLADAEIKGLADRAAILAIERKAPDARSEDEQKRLHATLATFSEGPYRETLTEIARLETDLERQISLSATTLVMAEKEGEPMAHILERGEYELKGEEVSPGFPAFLPGLDESLPMNRLGLAQWLVHPEHPLTARVAVNRIWQELFGTGLVKTSDDFGTQGENPSHPELLDWLAQRFIESGWDVKGLYRTLLLSETYRQSSVVSGEMAKRDPENRLLARGPRFRLDAEVIRDQALAASGLLEPALGGRPVRPYQPAGIWEAVGYTNSNTQTFYQDYGAMAEHRRSLYTFWKRTAQAPNLAIFDAPNREVCVMRRERTNTPLQALVLMNDPQFVRAARHLALRVLGETGEREARLDRMAELVRGRPLDEAERRIVLNGFDQFLNRYESDRESALALLRDEVNESFSLSEESGFPAPELAAWTMVANQLMNLDEAINKH